MKLGILLISLLAIPSFASDEEDLGTQYGTYSHEVVLDALRAGNHDESKINDYYFKVKLFGIKNTAIDRKKEIEERENIEIEIGEFGEVQVEVLGRWKVEEGEQVNSTLTIEGDTIRLLVSDVMKKFEVKENEVAVMTEIEMYERNKQFYFLGKDNFIAKTRYFPIPPSRYVSKTRTNLILFIQDEFGTNVRFKINYNTSGESATETAGN